MSFCCQVSRSIPPENIGVGHVNPDVGIYPCNGSSAGGIGKNVPDCIFVWLHQLGIGFVNDGYVLLAEEDSIVDSATAGNVCPAPCNATVLFTGLNCTRYIEAAFHQVPETQLELDLVS